VAVDRVSLLGFLDHIDDAPPELAQLANIGYLLIGVGAFLTLMGFLGCCGAMKESKCMLLSVSVRMCSATACVFPVHNHSNVGIEILDHTDHHNRDFKIKPQLLNFF